MTAVADRIEAVRPYRFRRYPEYKASGVDWLREVPAHWQMKRLKTVAAVQLSNVDKHSEEGQVPVKLCNYVDVYYNDSITAELDFMNATATPAQVRRFRLRVGDVMITKDSESWTDIAVPAVVAEDLPDVLCGYHLAHIRPAADVDGRFLARQFAAIGARDQFHVAANGITRFGLGGDAIRGSLFAIPPIGEQRAIADFLDRETAKIDALVARKERLIELLQEKRTALITRAVTRGIDPVADACTTGSPAFPVIPKDWNLWKIRRLVRRVKRPIVVRPDREYQEIGIRSWGKGIFHKEPVRGALLGEKSVFRPEPGDFVLNIVFAWEGAVAVVSEHETGMIASHRFPTFRPAEHVDLDYLLMVLQSDQGRRLMEVNSPGAAGRNKTLRIGQFLDEELPLPDIEEQRAVVSAFREEERRLFALAVTVRQAIDHLKELRIALISAAVTGKIDLREAVPR